MAALCRISGVDVLRAPYEADAQLAYLAKRGSVQAVLTEDSDLVAQSCPCVLLKLERHSGAVQQLLWDDVQTVKVGGTSLSFLGGAGGQRLFLELCVRPPGEPAVPRACARRKPPVSSR